MVEDRGLEEIISSAAALSPRTLEEALSALVELVAPVFEIRRASVRVLRDDTLTIAALWSSGPTTLRKGMTMSRLASSLPEIVRTGAPLRSDRNAPGVLDDLLRTEGIRSWISIPIRSGEKTIALLSFSSGADGVFNETAFFEQLGAAAERVLVRLLVRRD